MYPNIDSLFIYYLFVSLVCTNATIELQKQVSVLPQDESENNKSLMKNLESSKVLSKIHVDTNNSRNVSQNGYNGQTIPIPVPIENPSSENELKLGPTQNKAYSEFPMEGGGLTQQSSTMLPITDQVKPLLIDDTSHSKGRKGVKYPAPSVVARKGVDQSGTVDHKNSSIPEIPIDKSHVKDVLLPVGHEKSLNTPTVTNKTKKMQEQIHSHKKPEVVSDEGDSYDFDKYPIIKTSTTGEDYVIIGIVIVIGIWFSVFGALIFYRRAGEYWDRRHYRRMDFLVEGMYND